MGSRAASGTQFGGVRSTGGGGSDWVERAARAGYAAKGAVHVLVGGLAAHAALAGGGQADGSQSALQSLRGETGGVILLALIALGLAGYVVWRFIEAALNPEDEGAGKRVLFAISGIIYAGLALEAGRLALGNGGGGGGGGSHWSANLMSESWGIWLVAAAGAAVAGYGLYQLYKAYTAKLGSELDLRQLSSNTRRWIIRFGRFGLAARGVVLGIVGGLIVSAALNANAQEVAASGLGEALRVLERQSYGQYLLGTVALGLVAYGIFLMVKAAYRRIG